MNLNGMLDCLKTAWQNYLEKRSHQVRQNTGHLCVLKSRDQEKQRYRWLIFVAKLPILEISKSEQAEIRQHLKQAKSHKETAYLVIGFTQEPRRIVILPAEAALKTGFVRSDKGGIAWDD